MAINYSTEDGALGSATSEGGSFVNYSTDELSTALGAANIATLAKAAALAAQEAAETAETNAETAETNAATSATNAAASEAGVNAGVNTATAKAAEASTSATNAATSETNAATSETNASTSETNAATSETNAATSETNAATSATSAESSKTIATTKATEASTSAANAATSETNASTSETNAATSETNAATSATNASTSETNAATSETNASASASSASTSASTATTKATEAATSATNAAASEVAAETAETNAASSATAAAASATAAATSETNIGNAETNSAASATAAATSATTATTQATTATTKATEAAASATNAATSATTATTQATNAATSATTATTKATEASTSATNAAASATAAATSATAAQTAETAAETAETNAETAQTAAEAAEIAAEVAETAAEASETAAAASQASATASANSATASANSAASSATDAQSSEDDAATSEVNAANSAAAASSSASAASSSATNAATSATSATTSATTAATEASEASTSATNAATSESNASTSASTATTKASEASTSATSAATSATTATTKASEASTSATNAATSEANASTSATTATIKASEASTSETNAATSATSAAASLASFTGQYVSQATAPSSPDTGDLWFNETTSMMQVYDGTVWANAGSSINGTEESVQYTATAGQTTFAATYDVGYVQVYLNGIRLDTSDYTATNGTSIVLDVGAAVDDSVFIQAFGTFTLADHYTKVASDARYAQESYVDAEIAALVDSSPAALDTLNELAAALGDDPNFATTVNNNIATKAPLASPTFTGTVTADDLNVEGSTPSILLKDTTGPYTHTIQAINQQLRIEANNNLRIETNDTERLRIDGSGNVGINTSSPARPLHVKHSTSGALKLETTSDNFDAYVEFETVDNAAFIGIDDSQNVLKINNTSTLGGANHLAIASSGRVGIGTSSPNALLDVLGESDSISAIRIANPDVHLRMIAYTNSHAEIRVDTNHPLVFKTNGNSEKMRIDSSGNVGIGTSVFTGGYKLYVEGNGQTTANLTDAGNHGDMLYVRSVGAGVGSGGGVAFGTTFGNKTPFAAIKGHVIDGAANTRGHLCFSTRAVTSDTALTERMRIDGSGNVGIGTNNPRSSLEVNGDIELSGGIYLGGSRAAANNLDDYEEGTWSPAMSSGYGSYPGPSGATWTTSGVYTKVGREVHCKANITSNSSNGVSVGDRWLINGLPFSDNVTKLTAVGTMFVYVSIGSNHIAMGHIVQNNANGIWVVVSHENGSALYNGDISLSFTYQTDS